MSRSKSNSHIPTGVDPELLHHTLGEKIHDRMRSAVLQMRYQIFEEEVQARRARYISFNVEQMEKVSPQHIACFV